MCHGSNLRKIVPPRPSSRVDYPKFAAFIADKSILFNRARTAGVRGSGMRRRIAGGAGESEGQAGAGSGGAEIHRE